MCTLAGYIGKNQAAPLLLPMARRQEGLWSGFYSGLAVLGENGLQLDKVIGDMNRLEEKTGAASFQGTVGLVHSRTRSGGDREWGQPFLDSSSTVVGMAQGNAGIFSDQTPSIKLAEALLAEGWTFGSSTPGPVGRYPIFSNGCSMHTTEIIIAAAARAYRQGAPAEEAVRQAVTEAPGEAVYIFLFLEKPECIYLANVSQRVILGRMESGFCFATAALALPEEATPWSEVPPNGLATLSATDVRFAPLFSPGSLPLDASVPAGMEEAALRLIKTKPEGISLAGIVDGALAPLMSSQVIRRRAATGYHTVERLLASGMIRTRTIRTEGVEPGMTAPQTLFTAEA